MNVCRRVHYSGRVQGVGFRYTAAGVAQGYAVTGFVKNLPDGRVELVAEGEPGEVDRFLEALRRKMDGCIEEVSSEDETPQGWHNFRIAR